MAEHVWMSAARMHADLSFEFLARPAPSGVSTLWEGAAILECFIASLYSISCQKCISFDIPTRLTFQ